MKRVIATILVITLLVTTAQALEVEEVYNEVPEAIALSVINTPEVISEEMILKNGHIARVPSEESDMNTIVLLNEDNSSTLYYFQKDVKYVDSTGQIRDKSNQLNSTYDNPQFATDYSYVNSDNNVNTYFPTVLSTDTGVVLQTETYGIMIAPSTNSAGNVRKEDGYDGMADSVYYPTPFGVDTELKYTPTFEGFKEEIIIQSGKKSEFVFELDSGSLTPVCENNGIVLNNSFGETIISMDPIYVYDSFDGEFAEEYNNYCHTTWNNSTELQCLGGNKYSIIIHIDEDFLMDNRTQYPVYVDPSFRVTVSGYGDSKTIQDVTVYDGAGMKSVACGRDSVHFIGLANTINGKTYGVGRLLMKKSGLAHST